MQLLVASPTSRQWLTDLIFVLLEGEQYEYAFTFHSINVVSVNQPFAVSNGLPIAAAVGISESLKITMLIYYPLVSRLSHRSQMTILKHELLHVIEGHMSTYGNRLREEYGQEIAGIAMDFYVNQRLSKESTTQMAEDGYPLYLIEHYDLPPNLSSEDYCKLIQQKMNSGEMKQSNQNVKLVAAGDGVPPEQPGKPGDPFPGQGQQRPTEVFDLSKDDSSVADQATREVIKNVTESLESRGKEWNASRGFRGADHAAFIEASDRQSATPWHYYLRVMESRHRNEEVISTRSRLSRRCEHHMGRVRRNGLDVAFMVDTSGSMGAEQLRLVDAELRGMHARGAHITVLHCDADVAKVEEYNPFMKLEQFHGRGGTDFSPALLYTWDMYPPPSMFVGYTDGYGGIEAYVQAVRRDYGDEWYDEFVASNPSSTPDGIEALWMLPEGCMTEERFKQIVPWGNVIIVPTDTETEE